MHRFELHIESELDVCNNWRKFQSFLEQRDNTYYEAMKKVIQVFNASSRDHCISIDTLLKFAPSNQYRRKKHLNSKQKDLFQQDQESTTAALDAFGDFFSKKVEIIIKDVHSGEEYHMDHEIFRSIHDAIQGYFGEINNRIDNILKKIWNTQQKALMQKQIKAQQALDKEKTKYELHLNQCSQIAQDIKDQNNGLPRIDELEGVIHQSHTNESHFLEWLAHQRGFKSIEQMQTAAFSANDDTGSQHIQTSRVYHNG